MSDETIDVRLAHQRALARERQRRKRSRASHAVTMRDSHGVTAERHAPIDVAPGARRLAAAIAATSTGTPLTTALEEQGFNSHSRDLRQQVQTALQATLTESCVTVDRVARSTAESLGATSPMLTVEGCIEKPDWSARAAGRRDAIALLDRAGELPAAQQTQGGATITVNIIRYTQDVVVNPPDNDCETLTT